MEQKNHCDLEARETMQLIQLYTYLQDNNWYYIHVTVNYDKINSFSAEFETQRTPPREAVDLDHFLLSGTSEFSLGMLVLLYWFRWPRLLLWLVLKELKRNVAQYVDGDDNSVRSDGLHRVYHVKWSQ